MTLDLQALKAAAKAAGGGHWTASDGVVWFDDGDSALIADPVHAVPPVFLAYDNMGSWPEPIDREDVAAFAAAANPAVVLALVERLEKVERERELLRLAMNDGEILALQDRVQKAEAAMATTIDKLSPTKGDIVVISTPPNPESAIVDLAKRIHDDTGALVVVNAGSERSFEVSKSAQAATSPDSPVQSTKLHD